jgi:D-alanyl-D-alanine carboxypeptidase (penicillin-binding protein 5/6)
MLTLIIQQIWRLRGVSLKLYMAATHKRTKRGFIVSLIIILCVSYTAYALTEPFASAQTKTTFSYSPPPRALFLNWPSYGEAAVGVAGAGVLATHGSTTPQATASIAKILTALAVLKQQPLILNQTGPVITLTQTDVDSFNKYLVENGSVVKVAVGEQISEYQALEAMLMPSANNIAETLARWAFGTIADYNSYANNYAKNLGMTNTTITDPSGFLGTTVSSAHDLVILGEAAVANPVIAHIAAQTTATIPVQGIINNVNILLGQDGIVGLKTGNNDQDQGCFLFASRQTIGPQTVTVVGVIMNGPSLGTAMWDALPLISSAAATFHNVTVVKAGNPVATYTTAWGNQGTILAQQDLSIIAWNNSAITTSISLHRLQAPLSAGSSVGTLTVNDATSHTKYYVPLRLQQSIKQPSLFWRFTHSL